MELIELTEYHDKRHFRENYRIGMRYCLRINGANQYYTLSALKELYKKIAIKLNTIGGDV